MYRVKMEVYFDINGTNAEVVDTVRDYEMRNLVEFSFLDLVFGEPMIRNIDVETTGNYQLLTEECDVFSST
jgi:hypothetical protein